VTVTLARGIHSAASVLGRLSLDHPVEGTWRCYTLEHPSLLIPPATYPLRVMLSERASTGSLWSPNHRDLPRVQNVAGREGILIHAGNTAHDTTGCILVGLSADTDAIYRSRDALRPLMERLGNRPALLTITERDC
jgi:hypothetical protein